MTTLKDKIIILAHQALRSTKGESVAAIKTARTILSVLNDVAGQPLCSAEELEKRQKDRTRSIPPPPSAFRTAAPKGPAV